VSENIARTVELERTAEEDLADDVVFEPSIMHENRKVAIAVKDGLHVCWCCFKSVTANTSLDALMGEGIVVRICEDNLECRKKVGEANRKRDRDRESGNIIQLADLTEAQRVELVEEIKEKKKIYRG
jgi:hypothetical protein